MKGRSLVQFCQDILEAIAEIEGFTADVDFDAFSTNREKILAIVKLLEILGEATKKIPDEVRSQYSSIPWKSIAGMRDMLVHEYWGIDVNVVWATVKDGLPPFKAAIAEILSSLRED